MREENELMFYSALRKNNVRAELHLYPDAPHGSGMEATSGPTSIWPKLCTEWLRWNGWAPKSDDSMMRIQTRAEAGARGGARGGAGLRGGRGGAPAAAPAASATGDNAAVSAGSGK